LSSIENYKNILNANKFISKETMKTRNIRNGPYMSSFFYL